MLYYIKGYGYINFTDNPKKDIPYINLNSNFKGKPISIPLSEIDFIRVNESNYYFLFHIKLKYEMRLEIAEVNYGESRSELILNKNGPFFYLIKFSKNEYLDVNLRIINHRDYESRNMTTNFILEGYLLSLNSTKRIMNGEIIELKNGTNGTYDSNYKNGLLQVNKTNDIDYLLIRIIGIGFEYIQNTKLLIEVISLEQNKDNNFILPINQYVMNSFNLENNKTSISYFLQIDNSSDSLPIIEFSSNYNDTTIDFSPKIVFESVKDYPGIKKFRILKYIENITVTIHNTKSKPNTNFILRYFFHSITYI
jgi:hypothetical protein